MHYLWSIDIYFSASYNILDYGMIYQTLGHTHPVIFISLNKGE